MSNFYLHIKDFDGDIWAPACDADPNEKWIDNQFEVEQAIADNELTGAAQQKIAEQLNLYGIYYSAVIDKCTSGLELTDIGKVNLKIWLQASNASKDNSDSMMVRALSNNSEMLLTDIQAMFEQIENAHHPVELSEVIATSKVGKIAAYYKKTQGFLNTVNNYHKELDKAKKVLKNHPDTLENIAKLGIKMPGNERLLKIFLSKPMLSVNNLAVRLGNIMFSPLNNSSAINKINHHACLMLNLSFFGLYKKAQQAILQAENNVSNAVVNSQWFKNALPKTQALPGGVVMRLTKKMRESDLKVKSEYVKQLHNKNRVISRVLDIKEAGLNAKILKATKEDIENFNITRSQSSKGFKDIRLAFIIAAFEIYNWLQIKDKTQGDHNDSFWSAEMIGASLAMSSATTELMYQFVKTVTGSNSVAAGRIKVMSGFFGAAAGLYVSCQKVIKSFEEDRKGNTCLAALNLLNGILYFINAGIGFAAAMNSHIPWLTSRITKRALAKGLSRDVIARAIAIYSAQIMARRVILLGFGLWFGVISLLVEGLICYISDNELESWIKFSALGAKNDDAKAYKNITEQQDAFKAALKEMVGIDQSTIELDQQNQLTAKVNAAQQLDSEAEHDFNEFDALMLITNDLEGRHQAKLEALAIKNQPQQIYPLHPNAVVNCFQGIIN